jgi:hypothetical protein
MSSRHLLVLCTALAFATACERQAPIVDNTPRWKLDTVATITGPTSGTPFSSVRGLALHPNGRLVVVDHGSHTVTAFGPQGVGGAPVSRFGAGPADYKEPYYAAWLGDTLAIYDPEMTRVLMLGRSDAPAGAVQTLKVTGGMAVRFYPVSASKAYMRSVRIDGTAVHPVFVGLANARATDTVPVNDPLNLVGGTACHAANGAATFFDWPEAPAEIVVPVRDDGAVAYARSDEYRIVIRSPHGDSLAVLQHAIEPVPFSTRDWNDALLPYNTFVMKHGSPSCEGKPPHPQFRAPIRAITVSAEGDVWVTTLQRGGLAFDVFGADGTLKATVPAPKHVTAIPVVVAGDRIAMVSQAANGATVVQLYHIVR